MPSKKTSFHAFFRKWSVCPDEPADHEVAFFVPAKANDRGSITATQEQIFRAVRNFLVIELGGLTAIRSDGYFKNDKTNTVDREETVICLAYCTAQKLEEHAAAIKQLANAICIEFDQTCAAVAIDHCFYAYAPSDRYRAAYKKRIEKLAGNPDDAWGYRKYVDALSDSEVTM